MQVLIKLFYIKLNVYFGQDGRQGTGKFIKSLCYKESQAACLAQLLS